MPKKPTESRLLVFSHSNRGPMLGTKRLRDQHGVARIEAGRVGDDFSKMVMVRVANQVFDHDACAGVPFAKQEIRGEGTDRDLRPLKFQVHPKRLAQVVRICRQERRELTRFVRPDLADRNADQAINRVRHRSLLRGPQGHIRQWARDHTW